MSLLEDIFLQDEAGEAQELERVIEGDDYDERRRDSSEAEEDENVIGADEAEEDKRRVDPTSTKTKRVTKNPRVLLNPARLTGPRGIQVIPDHFKDFKFKGKGHEKEDLDLVLKKLEHWAYRLYPKFQFGDCLKKIETLGKKRPVMVHLHKIRTDQFLSEETVNQKDSSDEETPAPQEEDEFDKLLQQQIELAKATPAPGSVKKVMETPKTDHRSPLMMPKATSSPSISDEQKERMIRNRKLAEERRIARLKLNSTVNNDTLVNNVISEETETITIPDNTDRKQNTSNGAIETIDLSEVRESTYNNTEKITPKKHNRLNIIDSSDEESHSISATNNDKLNKEETIVIDYNTETISPKQYDNGKIVDTIDLSELKETENVTVKKHNKSNVIDSDSSEDECNVTTINQSITADIHTVTQIESKTNDKDIENVDAMEDETSEIAMEVNEKAVANDRNDKNDQVRKEMDINDSKIDEQLNLGKVDEGNTQDNVENNVANTFVDSAALGNNVKLTENATESNIDEKNSEKQDSTMNSKNEDLQKEVPEENLDDLKENNVGQLTRDVNLQENVVNEFTEEIMDVDFSDDF